MAYEPPTATDGTVTTSEDVPYTFTAADFNFSDPDGAALSQVQITTLESSGSLRLNGADVTLNPGDQPGGHRCGSVDVHASGRRERGGYDGSDFTVHDGTEYSSPALIR